MDVATAQQFLRENENAVLATWRRDGRLQMSPVTVGLDGAGRAIVSSRETAYKVRNLRRDPRAALCVFVEAFTGPWVQIEGIAEIVTLPEAMEPLVDYYRRLAGEPPAEGAALRGVSRRSRRPCGRRPGHAGHLPGREPRARLARRQSGPGGLSPLRIIEGVHMLGVLGFRVLGFWGAVLGVLGAPCALDAQQRLTLKEAVAIAQERSHQAEAARAGGLSF